MTVRGGARQSWFAAVALLLMAWGALHGWLAAGPQGVSSDARAYVTLAYNLACHGVYSLAEEGAPRVATHYREPGYPAYLAAALNLAPDLCQTGLPAPGAPSPMVSYLKRAQLPLFLGSALAVFAILRWSGVGRPWQILGLALVVFSGTLGSGLDTTLSEMLCQFLLLAVSGALLLGLRQRSVRWLTAGSVFLGLLILTKAVFLFFVPLFAGLCWPVVRRRGRSAPRRAAVAALLLAGACVPPFLWSVRNRLEIGTWSLCSRSGVVLLARSNLNRMTRQEYLVSFLYLTPDDTPRALLERLFGPRLPDVTRRLDWSGPDGFRMAARQARASLAAEMPGAPEEVVDRELQRRALREILAHPLRHLAVTLPVAVGGVYVESRLETRVPCTIRLQAPVPLSWAYALSLAFVLTAGARRWRWERLAFAAPAAYMMLFHALLTHNIPRYNTPALPVLVVCLCWALAGTGEGVRPRDQEEVFREGAHPDPLPQ
jgi:hypothetical protein